MMQTKRCDLDVIFNQGNITYSPRSVKLY